LTFEEYQQHDAVGLAEIVRKREARPEELLDAALRRAESVNPALNAIVRTLEQEARRTVASDALSGPLAGVPFLLKDISAQLKGVPTSAGSRLFADQPAADDSAIVRAYKEAGLVIFGKTNTPEFGLAATTEPVLFGPTHNPWDLQRTPGGSSGGSAAAVAACIVPAAHASDGGGSIRIPASCCGLFGLKPSRGRVSMAPVGEGWGGLSVQHVLTRSVRDSATLLDIACQPQAGDPYWLAPPPRPFAEQARQPVGRLRIGFSAQALIWGKLDPQCLRALDAAAALCESLGHEVEQIDLPGDFQAMAAAVNVVVGANVAAMLDREGARRGAPIREEEVERLSWSISQEGGRTTAAQYAGAMQTIHAMGRTIGAVFVRRDVVILSTLGKPPLPLGVMDTNAADLSGYGEELYSFMPNTQPFNVSGSPAMSVPLAWSDEGLPIGVQFAGRMGDEATLLGLATQLEEAQPWSSRRPDLEPGQGRGLASGGPR